MPKVKTVALSEDTFEKLTNLKRDMKAESYEKAIAMLIENTRKPKSMFGANKGMKPFTQRDEREFEGSGRF